MVADRIIDDVLQGTQHTGSVFLPTASPEDQGPTTAQRMAIYTKEAGVLAKQAAARALKDAGTPASAITHLVTVSCTGFVAPGLDLALIDGLDQPAFVLGRRMDILATNRMARALLTDFDARPPRERNHARWIFLDPATRDLYLDWPVVARENVAILRHDAAQHPDDPQLRELIGDPLLRTLFIMAMVLFGASLVAFVVAPGIVWVVQSLRRTSRTAAGTLGEVSFLFVLGGLIFWLYYRNYIHGTDAILLPMWRNPGIH